MFEMSFMWTRENMAFAYINDYISANVNEGKAKKVMISSLITFESAL